MTSAPLLAVDAPSLYFRAFHGIPTTAAVAPDGTPVNAVRGFLDMLATLVRTRRPGRLVCAWDADWRPDWRVALLPSYKSHRVAPGGGEQIPEALAPQVPVIRDVLAAVGIAVIGVPGYEADDVLGTLAATQPAPVEVVSGDRDLTQLVNDTAGVTLLYTGRGVATPAIYDEAAVQARYGVPAAAYVDYAVLRGDPSDGLPGVRGVGEKTAARWITEYGSLAAMLAALDDPAGTLAPAVRAKLANARDYLAAALPVVRVDRRVPLPAADLARPRRPAEPARFDQLVRAWNLTGPATRLRDALAAAPGVAQGAAPDADMGTGR